MSDDVRAAHLASIDAALGAGTVTSIGAAASRRRRIVAGIVAAALIGPTGLAAASSDALPGDTLYGVKQVSEQVVSVFDPDLVARNRVAEAEALASLGRDADDAVTRADEAVSELPIDHPLRARLAALLDDDRDDDDDRGDELDDDDASEDLEGEQPSDDVVDEMDDDEIEDDEIEDDETDEPAEIEDDEADEPDDDPADDDEIEDDEANDPADDDSSGG